MKKLILPEHRLQIDILNGLRYAPFVRFSELKPKNIESNLFLYHMRQLIKTGLVVKTEAGYGLSDDGKAYMSKSSSQNMAYRVQPTMLSVLCINDPVANKWLITKRRHQPFLGVVGFPSGKIHEGEHFAEAAAREAAEKVDLPELKLEQKGVFEVRYWHDDVVARHIVGIASLGTATADPAYRHESPDFESYWADESVLFGDNVFAEHDKLLKLIKQPGTFIESFDSYA